MYSPETAQESQIMLLKKIECLVVENMARSGLIKTTSQFLKNVGFRSIWNSYML